MPLWLLDLRVRILGERSLQGLLLAGINLSAPTQEGDAAPREWVVTRFIADMVRSRPTLDGILYTSSKQLPFGENIVVLKSVPVDVSTAPAHYRWSWKTFGFPFEAVRTHMKAEPMQ